LALGRFAGVPVVAVELLDQARELAIVADRQRGRRGRCAGRVGA
jgi:hypothetical protein